jgi:hypothetical protein
MRILLIALAALLLVGCNTLKDARDSKGKGASRSFEAPFQTVWKVIPTAANELDLSIAGTYEDEKYYLAERGATAFSWGERVAIFVTPESDSRTSVEVVSKKAQAMNITARNFERPLLDKIGEKLQSPR